MKIYDVYPRFAVEPVSGRNLTITDRAGVEYLDLYGGHAVISIGHAHARFVEALTEQAARLPFYSNSVVNPIADRLAERLGEVSGYPDYDLFLCNSGAEAIENGLKLASWKSGGDLIIAFDGAFHGRTSLAVAATDNPRLKSPLNEVHNVLHLPLNEINAFTHALSSSERVAAVLIEGIQGIGGVVEPSDQFLQAIAEVCRKKKIPLILDEIQSGYGRTGDFFAHTRSGIRPDLITVAKGMGNGFPIGGLLIAPEYEARHGSLGTTFGGNHLASAAALAVLDVLDDENLMQNAAQIGAYLAAQLRDLTGVTEVRGRGLMIGLDLDVPAALIRRRLLDEQKIFTGSSSRPETLRLLPPLTISREEADRFIQALSTIFAETDA